MVGTDSTRGLFVENVFGVDWKGELLEEFSELVAYPMLRKEIARSI